MKRTTLILDDELFRRVKKDSLQAGQSFKDYVTELLRLGLTSKKKVSFHLQWKTQKGDPAHLLPVEDRDRLFDLLD